MPKYARDRKRKENNYISWEEKQKEKNVQKTLDNWEEENE